MQVAGWILLGFIAQTLVAWSIGLNPQGWRVSWPSKFVDDANRVSAMFADGRYSVVVSHGLAPLRNEFRIRYQDLGSAEGAEAYIERWRVAGDEVAEADPKYAGKRTVRDAPPGMQVYTPIDKVAGIGIESALPGGSREIGRREELKIMTTGWPFQSCRMTWVEQSDETLGSFQGVLVDPAVVPRSWRTGSSMYYPGDETIGAIPAFPMLAGTIGNALFFGGSGFLAINLLGVLRRRRRVKLGMCVGCGYDLRSAPSAEAGCPECGHRSQKA